MFNSIGGILLPAASIALCQVYLLPIAGKETNTVYSRRSIGYDWHSVFNGFISGLYLKSEHRLWPSHYPFVLSVEQ